MTYERIADIQNRLERLPYRQVPDSIDFQLVRAKLRAELDAPAEARVFFEAEPRRAAFPERSREPLRARRRASCG